MISKLYPTRSHTGAAQGGVCAALANVEEDSPEWHAFDTVKGGDYLVDQPAAQIMCNEAIDAIYELEHWGLPFNRTPRDASTSAASAGTPATTARAPVMRACYAADRTGHMILQTLYQQCVKRDVRFFNEFYCLDLLMEDGRCAGIVAYELATGELHVFRAKSVLFATGGYGRMFRVSSNAHALTGDGPAVVYRRGLPLEDMEFFQFHPTGMYKLGILLSEAVRGEGGILLNSEGERFMERYAPTIKDLAPRDMVSRAIYQEIREGRGDGPSGDYVYLDLTHLPPAVIEEKLPDITEFARVYLQVEPTNEPVPIQPTAHYAMGGIPTDIDGQVVVGPDEVPVPGAVRGRRVRLRLGARREPPGHELTARHRRVRAPGRSAHGRAREGGRSGPVAGQSHHPDPRPAGRDPDQRPWRERGRHPQGTAEPHVRPGIRGSIGREFGSDAAHPRGAARALRPGWDHGQGCRLQHRSDGDGGGRFPPGLRRGTGAFRAGTNRESRGALSRGSSPSRRRQLAQALTRDTRVRRLHQLGLQAGEDGALYPDGEEVLMTSAADVLNASDRRGADDPTTVPLTLRIRRFNPEVSQDSWWDEFEVRMEPLDRLLDALHEVKWYQDGTLALRRSCAHGICGSDAMLINGRNALACKVLVKDVAPKVTIEPIRGLAVLKDLIVDMEPFFDGYRSVLPFLVNDEGEPDKERYQSAEQRARYDDTTKCILCAACTTSCPIFWGDEGYVGPAAIVNAHRFIFDSRDQGSRERLKILSEKTGVFRCRTTFNCTEACPRGIQVTKAIQEVKRSILFDRF